ncbi:unnamed protein product [Moneuplotes crassus]|uniref:Uncharacterized protein n=1 Tax=Euplotes crassus TaxID=5936 RepID=A0AAD1XSV9_EUPCR|nr:unnamed protein product [Moneuplotes crassus]
MAHYRHQGLNWNFLLWVFVPPEKSQSNHCASDKGSPIENINKAKDRNIISISSWNPPSSKRRCTRTESKLCKVHKNRGESYWQRSITICLSKHIFLVSQNCLVRFRFLYCFNNILRYNSYEPLLRRPKMYQIEQKETFVLLRYFSCIEFELFQNSQKECGLVTIVITSRESQFILFNNSFRDPINLPTCYLDPIIRLNFRVLNKMCLECFCINFRNLKKFITSFRHVETLCILLCKLSIPEIPDFAKALNNTSIQKFKLCWSGLPNASNWVEDPQELTNLIQGLSTSPDLKLSLQEVDLRRCLPNETMARSLLEENGFGSAKVII